MLSIQTSVSIAPHEPEPVDAIFSDDEVPEDQIKFIELNAELAEQWPNITERRPPHDHEEWAGKPNKFDLLEGN